MYLCTEKKNMRGHSGKVGDGSFIKATGEILANVVTTTTVTSEIRQLVGIF
jgi:hypothetical protein